MAAGCEKASLLACRRPLVEAVAGGLTSPQFTHRLWAPSQFCCVRRYVPEVLDSESRRLAVLFGMWRAPLFGSRSMA